MSALVMALVLLAALAVAIGWLRPGSTAPIVDARGKPVPGSIAVLEKVKLGGVAQSLLIRGQSAANPVLLYLHDGPGTSELGMLRPTTSRPSMLLDGIDFGRVRAPAPSYFTSSATRSATSRGLNASVASPTVSSTIRVDGVKPGPLHLRV